MSKRCRLYWLGASALAGVLIWSLVPREPAYQGKSLTHWLNKLNRAGSLENTESVEAIRAMGARSLPYLLGYLQKDDPWFKKKFRELIQKQRWVRWQKTDRNTFSTASTFAFQQLGPVASPALPDLIRRLSSQDAVEATGVELALFCIGPTAIPTLEAACESTERLVRVRAVRILVKLIKDDPDARMGTVTSLQQEP